MPAIYDIVLRLVCLSINKWNAFGNYDASIFVK
jgi:hypothetical protein